MANITVTEVGDSLATIVAAQALGYLQANTVLAMLVNRDYDNEVAVHGQVVKIPFTGALIVNDKSANAVVTLQTPNDSAVSVTLNQHKEVSFLIEDVAEAMSRPNFLESYVADAMAVLAEQVDEDLAGLYSGFSQTIDATSGLAEDDFREAGRQLNTAKAPQGNRVAVLHEDAAYALLGIDRFINSDYGRLHGGEPVSMNGYLGYFLGFQCYMDQKIAVATTQCKNLFMHRNAAVLVSRPLPQNNGGAVAQTVMAEGNFAIRVTIGYDKDHLGTQVTVDTLYGLAELRDNHGVVVSTTEI